MIARSCATALLTAFLLFGSQPAGVQPNPNADSADATTSAATF